MAIAIGGGFYLSRHTERRQTASLASFLEKEKTLLYVQGSSEDLPATLNTLRSFLPLLPTLPDAFLEKKEDDIELALVTSDGEFGWISMQPTEAGTGTVRFSSETAKTAWLQDEYKEHPSFMSSPLVSASLLESDNAFILMMSGSSLISSGSLLARLPDHPLAVTSTWNKEGGAMTVWMNDRTSRPAKTHIPSSVRSIPLRLIVTNPSVAVTSVKKILQEVSPGLYDGMEGILAYQLGEHVGRSASLHSLSSLGEHPVFLSLSNSGADITYAFGGTPSDDVMTTLWSGAVLQASRGTIRTTPLLRNQVHRDMVEEPVTITESDEHGWHVRRGMTDHPLLLASSDHESVLANDPSLLSDAMQTVPLLSTLMTDIAGSLEASWLQEMMKGHLPFLMTDPSLAPLFHLLPLSGRIDFSFEGNATSLRFSWRNAPMHQESSEQP